MAEWDLRKLPSHKKVEVFEKAKIKEFQKSDDEGKKLTLGRVEWIKKKVSKEMEEFERENGGVECWSDWGEKFLQRYEPKIKEKEDKSKLSVFTNKKIQAEVFEEVQPYFYDKSGLFWLWDNDNFCWKQSDDIEILNMIENETSADVITPNLRTIILNTLKQTGRRKIPQDIKPTWIQFKDKIIDIETAEEFDASPKYFVTNPIPWQRSDIPDTPNMDRIFEEWVGKDYVELLYEILAYCILPDIPIHRIFCFIGEGMNGKSKFLELLRTFVGEYNCCATELDILLKSRFEVTRLHKKLVCQMGETNFNEMSKTSLLKKLSGGDLIGFEYKNKNPFDDKNYAKILIATNNLPSTTDKTLGFYRRWCIIDFPNKFGEKKNILEDIPEKEYESLALRCIITLKSLLRTRKFTNEGSVEERTRKYEAKSNFLETFIKEFTKESIDGYITKNEFYRKFTDWCKENRHRNLSETSLGLSMKRLGIESGKKYFNWLYDGKGGDARVWLGISWKE